jgi:hypothetical protein
MLENFFNKIGHFFLNLFNAANHAYNHLQPEVQNALVHGAGIINLINENLQGSPMFLVELINQKFPGITKEKLLEGLHVISNGFRIAETAPDIETTIKNLQTYFSSLKGEFWEGAASTAAQLLSIVFAPETTPFAKIAMLIEFVYRTKIKK